MSGRRAKQIRRELGISISARRDIANFAREIERAKERRAARLIEQRRARRQVLAAGALALIAALIAGALFL